MLTLINNYLRLFKGEWMRKKRKGYIKVHVAVDVKTKQVVSMDVTDSGFKGIFGVDVMAKGFERVVGEMELKVWVYNLMLGMGQDLALSGRAA